MKNIIHFKYFTILVFIFCWQHKIISQNQIPQNTLDKSRIPSWIIAKTSQISEKKMIEIINDPMSFYNMQDSTDIRELNLSKLNDITVALYQLYDSLSYKSNFVITSIINSERDQDCYFVFNSFDLESSIFINGQKQVTKNDGLKSFDVSLKKGINEIVIFSKSLRRNLSSFLFEIISDKYSKVKLIGRDKNKNLTPYAFTQILNQNGLIRNERLDENGELNIRLIPGDYKFRIATTKEHLWSEKFSLKSEDQKTINLTLKNKAVISGNLYKYDNKTPNSGVQVSIINSENNKVIQSLCTGEKGEFKFFPPDGQYNLRFTVNDNYIFHKSENEITNFTINSKIYEHKNLKYSLASQSDVYVRKVGMFDGLLSDECHKLTISKNKLLYIGTYNGLSIYNGVTIKSYNYEDGLPNGSISDVIEDSKGNIWISFNEKGLVQWKNGQVIRHFTTKDGLPSNHVNIIREDNKGDIVIGTGSGLSIYDGKTFKNYNFTKGISNGFITALEIVGNNIWIGCSFGQNYSNPSGIGGGLSIFNGKKFKSFEIKSSYFDYRTFQINCITSDKKGNILIGTDGGLLKYNGSNFTIYREKEGLISNKVQAIYVDDDQILIGTNQGLNFMSGDKIKSFVTKEISELSSGRIYSINKSNDGVYFVGTTRGLYLFDPNSFDIISNKQGIANSNIWYRGIMDLEIDSDGVMWAASGNNGVYKIVNNKIVKTYNTRNSNISSNYVIEIEIANDGAIWLAHNSGGVSKIQNDISQSMNQKLGIKDGTTVSDIAFSYDGSIWLASNKGLGKYKNDSLNFFDESDGLVIPIGQADVNIGNKGEIIYSTYGEGMSVYQDGKFTNFTEDNGLKDNRIWDLDIDSKNNYWLALDGKCVQKFDGKTFTHYGLEDGITAGETNTAYVDELDNVWIGTFGGGVCNFDGKYWNSIDSRDGLLENTITSICGVNGNKYWFGSQNGISCYLPKHQIPSVFIEKIETSKGSFESLADLKSKNEKLLQGSRITFTLNSNSFNTKEEKQKFLVSIIQKGKKNTRIIKSNKFDFFPKNAGKYQLEFQSIDRDMNYSKAEIIDFKIISPWYLNPVTAIPFWGGLITILSLLLYVTKKYLNQRKYSIQLKEESQKNDREARARLEEKNKEIVDSINYAKRIQDAMMTSEGYRKSVIPKSFILFKPKDVVSGDFYWVYKDQEDNIFFTVADCTGHGVPGAFMSMIGTSLLNEIIVEKGINDTNKILDEMRKQIIKSLNQDTADDQKDGMDISLCKLNLKKKTLEFSGAHNPLVTVSGNELNTFKGDSQAVGLETVDKKPFTKHSMKLKKDDMIYIYSDGYQDQFGGDNGKKYMTANFKKLLLKVSKEDERKQNKLLEKELDNWMKNEEQIDDICVMGVRI